MVNVRNRSGFTLLELIASLGITLIIMAMLTSYLTFIFKNGYNKFDEIVHARNTRFALNYIEKRLREMDQKSLVYHSNLKAIEGFTSEGYRRWIDLSGYRRNSAFIYFHEASKQIRVNLNNENNVLVTFINQVEVTEMDSGNLIEIEVFSSEINYSVKARFYVNTINR